MSEDLYSLAHPRWFETIERFAFRPRYYNTLQEMLPAGWSLERHSMWLGAKHSRPVPMQGFKIHVSTIQKHAVATLRTVATACFWMVETWILKPCMGTGRLCFAPSHIEWRSSDQPAGSISWSVL